MHRFITKKRSIFSHVTRIFLGSRTKVQHGPVASVETVANSQPSEDPGKLCIVNLTGTDSNPPNAYVVEQSNIGIKELDKVS